MLEHFKKHYVIATFRKIKIPKTCHLKVFISAYPLYFLFLFELFFVLCSEVEHNGCQLFHGIPSGGNSGFKVNCQYIFERM